MTKRAALILAGGKAHRFQTTDQSWQDKALALLEDKPLLIHIIENITTIVDEIIICTNQEERKIKYHNILEKHKIEAKIVTDEKTNVNGPNAAILTGLKNTQADICITIPCDMPFIKPNVADHLLNLAKNFDIVMPIWPNGELETLIMTLQHAKEKEIIQTLCQLKRTRPNDIPRATPKTLLSTPLKTIKIIDPALKSFININTQNDLKKLQTRNTQGPIQEDIQLIQKEDNLISNLQQMRNAAKMYQENQLIVAQEKFDQCKNHFEKCDNFFWTALSSENKGKTLLKQIKQQKENNQQAILEFGTKYKEACTNATHQYNKEIRIYKKHQCTRLLERAIADKQQVLNNSRMLYSAIKKL
ncbi:MAG: molybdenum cofactor guanylyltransferase [Nitrososphaerota archaeon]|jgi:molybdopterin-guanine dinucleotide biosynthesis protein A|nr:molybdenum cofactor guanylyltransferase [Nitrososphaerota archaeon]